MTSPLLRRALRLLLPLLLATPALAVPPISPTGFALTWNTSGLINCSWTDRSNDEAGFIIRYRTNFAAPFTESYDAVAANTTTYSNTPTGWPGCTSFQWVVFAYKGSLAAPELSSASNIVTVTAPPRVNSAAYASGGVGQPFSHTLTTSCPLPVVWTASPIPPGLSFNAATGVITGFPTIHGRNTVNVTLTSGGKTVSQALKLYVFRPVPAKLPPLNGTPLTDRTLRRNAAPSQVDLNSHFNDPDVTDATRLQFNIGNLDFLYYPTAAPANVANFKGYVTRGDFMNTIIHRSLDNFVIQGGGYKAEAGTPSIPRQAPVVNEPEITNTRGTVAMAKSADSPDSATSEFFVSVGENSLNLNNQNEGFTVFARVSIPTLATADLINGYCTYPFSAVNPVLSDCPVTTHALCPTPQPAAPAFSTDLLVKVISAGPVAPLSYNVQSSHPAVCGASVNGAQLSLTPLAAGTATITVTATDLDNFSLQRTFGVTVEEHLSDWLAAQNFPNGADAAALANPDGDTGLNIMEFALMTNPQSPQPVPAPVAATTVVATNKFLTLTFPVRKLTGSGFVYSVESHNTLTGAWTEVWKSSDGFTHAQVVSSTDLPDRTEVTIRDNTAIATGGKHYLRLRVTDSP